MSEKNAHNGTTPQEDFTKIPYWNKGGGAKRFEVMADKFSGRIPVTRLESWREFADLLECSFFNRPDTQLWPCSLPSRRKTVKTRKKMTIARCTWSISRFSRNTRKKPPSELFSRAKITMAG